MDYYGLRVYDIAEGIVASGFPMVKQSPTPSDYEQQVKEVEEVLQYISQMGKFFPCITNEELYEDICNLIKTNNSSLSTRGLKAVKRAISLGSCTPATGHDSYCKSCLVTVNIKADQSFWLQWERYHHQDTVSSMSTMHCLTKFEDIDSMFSKYTDQRVIDILKEKIEEYNNNSTSENFYKVIHSCPEGIQLTRRVVTNYLQLKNMYNQRKHHKMESWSKDFINMCNELPYFLLFTNTNTNINNK